MNTIKLNSVKPTNTLFADIFGTAFWLACLVLCSALWIESELSSVSEQCRTWAAYNGSAGGVTRVVLTYLAGTAGLILIAASIVLGPSIRLMAAPKERAFYTSARFLVALALFIAVLHVLAPELSAMFQCSARRL